MLIRLAAPTDKEALTDMRAALWSDTPREEHHRELEQTLAGRPQSTLPLVIFVAEENAQLVGFAEVGLRSHADGCDPVRPVGFLEGWYVRPDHMGRGIGRALVERAEDWARRLGCTEFASDTWADNEASQRAHLALGFEVVDRCVNYRKSLVRQGQAELEVVSPSSQSVTGDEFTESYNQVIADYYDDAYRDLLAERGDIDFYAELAAEREGPVLELGCGTGRVLLELVRRGIPVVGLDSSRAMLDKLRRRAQPSVPELVLAQMQAFDLRPRRFGLIYAAFREFQHLYDVDAQLACLSRVAQHLKPGGTFAFDVFNPRLERALVTSEPEHADLRFEKNGESVVRFVSERRDPLRQLIEVRMRFETRRGDRLVKSESETIQMRWFTRYELEHLLARAGFHDVSIYGDFDRSPCVPGCPELVVVATKG